MDEEEPSTRDFMSGLLGYQLRRASAAMMADLAAVLSPLQLRPVQFTILSLVADNSGISQTELCRALAIRKANMVPLIAELDGRGLLTRKLAPQDRRVHMLNLTPRAEVELPVWRELVEAHERRFFNRLNADERESLHRLLRGLWSRAPQSNLGTGNVPGSSLHE
jgi:DNA-binding MarR family transcriptional regulator